MSEQKELAKLITEHYEKTVAKKKPAKRQVSAKEVK